MVKGRSTKVKVEKLPIPSAGDSKENCDPSSDISSDKTNLEDGKVEDTVPTCELNLIAVANESVSCREVKSSPIAQVNGQSFDSEIDRSTAITGKTDNHESSVANAATASSSYGSLHQATAERRQSGRTGVSSQVDASVAEKKSVRQVARTVHISANDVKNDQGCKTQ
jgi:hypothetical protein